MPSMKKRADGSTRTVRVIRNPHSKTFGFNIGGIANDPAWLCSPNARALGIGVLDPGTSSPVGALRVGDVFVSIDGVAVTGWSLERVTEEIRKAKGGVLTLAVRSPSPSTTSITSPTAAAAAAGGGSGVNAEVATAFAAINAAEAAAAHAAALALERKGPVDARGRVDSLATTFHRNPGLAGPLAASVALNTAATMARAAAGPGETGAKSISLQGRGRTSTSSNPRALTEDCGRCKNCLDKPKFGGPNKKRRACLHKTKKSGPHPAPTAAATTTPPAKTAERNPAKGSGRASSATKSKRAATTSKGTASKKTSKTPKGKASRVPAQPSPAAATTTTPAEQNRLGQVIKHGSAVILDEFDVPHIPITFDVRTEDPDWHNFYECLVQVRNASLLTLLCGLGHWSCRQYDTPGLDEWIEDQRSMYADRRAIIRGKPPTDDTFVQPTLAKIALLNAIHFVWLPRDRRHNVPIVHGTVLDAISDEEWKSYYDRLIAHTSERGHGIVPSYTELGMWCGMQRAKRRGGALDWTKVQALNALGFNWDGDELSDWYGMRARLAQFKAKFGDCLVMPPREVDDQDEDGNGNRDDEEGKEGSEKQGEEKNNGDTCSGDDIEEEQKKNEGEEKSEDVRNEEVQEEEDWSELWWWVQCQRIERKRTRGCLLAPSHVSSLDELDFIWTSDIKAAWICKFRELQVHHAKHGTFHVPSQKKKPRHTPLGKFVTKLRAQYQYMKKREEKERLKEEQSRSVSAGSEKLPVRDWRKFGRWKYGTGTTLTPTAIRLLDLIGFTWESEFAVSKLPTWEEKYEELRQYKEKMGNCLVHQKDPSGLGDWVKHMRKMYDYHQEGKVSPLNEERIRKLEELGFVWRVRGKRGKGLKKEESLREAREAWKIAREKRRSMESGAAYSEDVNHHNADEHDGDMMKSPRRGGDNRASGQKRKLPPSQERDESSCEEAARRDMVDTLTCRACSNIVFCSTACIPCGHSFCKSCIEVSLRPHTCPTCHTDVATLLPLRNVDRIVATTLQRGDFDAKDVDVYKRRSCDWVADHRENAGLI